MTVESLQNKTKEQELYLLFEQGRWRVVFLGVISSYVKSQLGKIKDALLQYRTQKGKLPESLSQLVPDYLEELPLDLFNSENAPYKYVKNDSGDFLIYSFGPDSDDDLGEIEYESKTRTVSNGDIIVRSK
jgi:hypothetical protein